MSQTYPIIKKNDFPRVPSDGLNAIATGYGSHFEPGIYQHQTCADHVLLLVTGGKLLTFRLVVFGSLSPVSKQHFMAQKAEISFYLRIKFLNFQLRTRLVRQRQCVNVRLL